MQVKSLMEEESKKLKLLEDYKNIGSNEQVGINCYKDLEINSFEDVHFIRGSAL